MFGLPCKASCDLDNARYANYSVRMTEHIVRNGAQMTVQQDGAAAPSLAAPMVERAFRLLALVSAEAEGLTLSELARALNMSKGSLHGLLRTLEAVGAVAQTPQRRYVLGARIFELAQARTQRVDLRRLALPAMRRLASDLRETILLGRVEAAGVRILERAEAPLERPELRIAAPTGMRVHLLAGAIGRLVAAHWPAFRREEFRAAGPLQRFTPHTITDPDAFLAAADTAARVGYSIDREEYLEGVNAVAAPIYGPGGDLLALVWAIGFSARFQGERLIEAGERLRDEAARLSQMLGATETPGSEHLQASNG
jgi:DNA-binding IclR family transcriptional regulator